MQRQQEPTYSQFESHMTEGGSKLNSCQQCKHFCHRYLACSVLFFDLKKESAHVKTKPHMRENDGEKNTLMLLVWIRLSTTGLQLFRNLVPILGVCSIPTCHHTLQGKPCNCFNDMLWKWLQPSVEKSLHFLVPAYLKSSFPLNIGMLLCFRDSVLRNGLPYATFGMWARDCQPPPPPALDSVVQCTLEGWYFCFKLPLTYMYPRHQKVLSWVFQCFFHHVSEFCQLFFLDLSSIIAYNALFQG